MVLLSYQTIVNIIPWNKYNKPLWKYWFIIYSSQLQVEFHHVSPQHPATSLSNPWPLCARLKSVLPQRTRWPVEVLRRKSGDVWWVWVAQKNDCEKRLSDLWPLIWVTSNDMYRYVECDSEFWWLLMMLDGIFLILMTRNDSQLRCGSHSTSWYLVVLQSWFSNWRTSCDLDLVDGNSNRVSQNSRRFQVKC